MSFDIVAKNSNIVAETGNIVAETGNIVAETGNIDTTHGSTYLATASMMNSADSSTSHEAFGPADDISSNIYITSIWSNTKR